jgi:hypothetical protein
VLAACAFLPESISINCSLIHSKRLLSLNRRHSDRSGDNKMDIVALASSVTTALVPLLPYLLKAGEKAAEETGKAVAGQSWEWAKSLWTKLQPKVEAKPGALEAVRDVAQSPGDEELQTALRVQLRKLLTEDQSLAEEVSRWLDQGKAAGINVAISGDRNVAIGGSVNSSTIVTGDQNKVKP